MFGATTWADVLRALAGKRRRRRPRAVQRGDVVCVADGILKRYGIWTGEAFIQYAKNADGKRVVHETSFQGFLRGAESLAICEFPKKYGHPTEHEQPVVFPSSVVMPQEKIWRMMEWGRKARRYKVYGARETVERAKSRLGDTGFATSEHFAMWCKTGVAESHQLEKMREWWDLVIVY